MPQRRPLSCLLPALLTALAVSASAGTLTLMDYNILNFPGSTGAQRAPYFRTVLASCQPDILVVQEILGPAGVQQFLTTILDVYEPDLWAAAPFHESYDTDRALFIRDACVLVDNYGWLDTDLRDIEWWDLRVAASDEVFRLYTMHLKASQGSDNEQQRLAECQILRASLDALPADAHYAVAGDYNLYTYGELAWQLLRSAGNGQLLDPINQEGNWHDNPAFAPYHTQSTRTADFGGGATGGMDDRFDFITASDDFLDGSGLDFMEETYHAHGQDGQHFNTSIIDGPNGAVPPEVAEALYQSSDHLPLVVDIAYSSLSVDGDLPMAAHLGAWPNPFNPSTRLSFDLPASGRIDLSIFDVSGRRIASLREGFEARGSYELDWRPQGLTSGLYLARLELEGKALATTRLVLIK